MILVAEPACVRSAPWVLSVVLLCLAALCSAQSQHDPDVSAPREPDPARALQLDLESAEIAQILTTLPLASPLLSGEVLLHLINNNKLSNRENQIYLLAEQFRRAQALRPSLPVRCSACDSQTVQFSVVLASQRNALTQRLSLLQRLQALDPTLALQLSKDLFRNLSPESAVFAFEGHLYDTRTDAPAVALASFLASQQHHLPADTAFPAYLEELLNGAPAALQIRTIALLLLAAPRLSDEDYEAMRGSLLTQLALLDLATVRAEDHDLSLIRLLTQLSRRYSEDSILLMGWTSMYTENLFSRQAVRACADIPAADITPSLQADGSDARPAQDPKYDLAAFYVADVAKPYGLAIPTDEQLAIVRRCLRFHPRNPQSGAACDLVSPPTGTSGLLRPLFAYKSFLFTPDNGSGSAPSKSEADAAVNQYIAAIDQATSDSRQTPLQRFLGLSAAYLVLGASLSDELWFPEAWRAYVDFLDRSDGENIDEFIWLGQAFPLLTLTSGTLPAERELLSKAKDKGLVPSFLPLTTKREDALLPLQSAGSANLRLLGLVQQYVPFQFALPEGFRERLER